MGVIEWREEDGITDALVGGVRMARFGSFKRAGGKITWWQDALLGFSGDEAEYYCWTIEEAKADIEEAVDRWLEKAGLVPKADLDYAQRIYATLNEKHCNLILTHLDIVSGLNKLTAQMGADAVALVDWKAPARGAV